MAGSPGWGEALLGFPRKDCRLRWTCNSLIDARCARHERRRCRRLMRTPAPQETEMGAGIAASPHCAELRTTSRCRASILAQASALSNLCPGSKAHAPVRSPALLGAPHPQRRSDGSRDAASGALPQYPRRNPYGFQRSTSARGRSVPERAALPRHEFLTEAESFQAKNAGARLWITGITGIKPPIARRRGAGHRWRMKHEPAPS